MVTHADTWYVRMTYDDTYSSSEWWVQQWGPNLKYWNTFRINFISSSFFNVPSFQSLMAINKLTYTFLSYTPPFLQLQRVCFSIIHCFLTFLVSTNVVFMLNQADAWIMKDLEQFCDNVIMACTMKRRWERWYSSIVNNIDMQKLNYNTWLCVWNA